jgi:hypothetical protein
MASGNKYVNKTPIMSEGSKCYEAKECAALNMVVMKGLT